MQSHPHKHPLDETYVPPHTLAPLGCRVPSTVIVSTQKSKSTKCNPTVAIPQATVLEIATGKLLFFRISRRLVRGCILVAGITYTV